MEERKRATEERKRATEERLHLSATLASGPEIGALCPNWQRYGDFVPSAREERRRLAAEDELHFCRIYFPEIFTGPWSKLHRHLATLAEGNYSISGFPQSGKSAYCHIAKLARHIILGRGGVAAMICRDIDTAKKHTVNITRNILDNALLRYDYEIDTLTNRQGYHQFVVDGVPTDLMARSVSTGLRSQVTQKFERIRIAVMDDLYNLITVRQRTDNEDTVAWITGEGWRQMEDSGLCIVLGNMISDDCPIATLSRDWPTHHFGFPILNAEGEPNWPEVWPVRRIEKRRAETPHDVWMSEYMESPLLTGDVFDPEWIRYVTIHAPSILATVSAVDPARGQSPAACFLGIATVSAIERKSRDGYQIALTDMYLRKEPFAQVFDYLLALTERMAKFKTIFWENDFEQWGYAQPYYENWQTQTGATLPYRLIKASQLRTRHRATDKSSRIMTLVHPHQTGKFVYDEMIRNHADFLRYRRQLLAFNGVATDNDEGGGHTALDGPDATATALIMLARSLQKPRVQSISTGGFSTGTILGAPSGGSSGGGRSGGSSGYGGALAA